MSPENLALKEALKPIESEAQTIVRIGYDNRRDISTLGIGEKDFVNKNGWLTIKENCFCVVPGNDFELGQMVRASDLPKDTQTIDQAYPHQN